MMPTLMDIMPLAFLDEYKTFDDMLGAVADPKEEIDNFYVFYQNVANHVCDLIILSPCIIFGVGLVTAVLLT